MVMIASSAHVDVDEHNTHGSEAHSDTGKRRDDDDDDGDDKDNNNNDTTCSDTAHDAVAATHGPDASNRNSEDDRDDDDDKDSHDTSSSVVAVSSPTVSRLHDDNDDDGGGGGKSARRLARERERLERLRGRLTTLTYADFVRARNNSSNNNDKRNRNNNSGSSSHVASLDFIQRGQLLCVMGSRSQFDARVGRLRDVMPPLTMDCCQTFATLSAIVLSSLCFDAMATRVCCTSTVNYLLYIAAWMHQLTMRSWPQRGVRPTVGDLNTCLRLRRFFPSKVHEDEFEVVFYNQASKATELLRRMCAMATTPPAASCGDNNDNNAATTATAAHEGVGHKRTQREATTTPSHAAMPICGYVIVSGDYTVSVYAVTQSRTTTQTRMSPAATAASTTNTAAAVVADQVTAGDDGDVTCVTATPSLGLYLCDSHGTQPWSHGKASVCGLCIDHASSSSWPHALDAGVRDFATMLFTLLEEHRGTTTTTTTTTSGAAAASARAVVPYMTWTPLRRRPALALDAEELTRTLDKQWLPCVLADAAVHSEARRFGFVPLECFWGLHTP